MTLQPFTVYHKVGDELKCISVCIISDHLEHNTNIVHAFIATVLAHLISVINIHRVIYLADAAASQYTNCKNLSNLCHYVQNFKVEAEWHFFATSDGKSPCDGNHGIHCRWNCKMSSCTCQSSSTSNGANFNTTRDVLLGRKKNQSCFLFLYLDRRCQKT